jgi:hypothetical protein
MMSTTALMLAVATMAIINSTLDQCSSTTKHTISQRYG